MQTNGEEHYFIDLGAIHFGAELPVWGRLHCNLYTNCTQFGCFCVLKSDH